MLYLTFKYIITNLFLFQVFKKRTETAKKEYLKQLAAYRASLVSKVCCVYTVLEDYRTI